MQNKIINFFLPVNCALCNISLPPTTNGICQDCALDIKFLQNTCKLCAQPLADKTVLICGKCLDRPPLWQVAIAPFAYAGATRFLIKALKFNKQLSLVKTLADNFVNTIKLNKMPSADLIIPVPLHRARLASRGFNQSFELAKIIGHKLGIPVVTNACLRIKNTPAQTGLNAKERKRNLKQAFVLKRPELIKQKHIILLDDVYTTGSTLKELASVCKLAKQIDIWCIAKVI